MSIRRSCLSLGVAVVVLTPWPAAVGQPQERPRDEQKYLTREELTKKYDQDGNGELSPVERRAMVQDVIEGRANVPPQVRENFRKVRKGTPLEIMNQSVNETMSRTIITAGTVFLVVIALYFFGGETLRGFSLALIVGVISGTFSTIYIASNVAILLGVSPANLALVKKEGDGAGAQV